MKTTGAVIIGGAALALALAAAWATLAPATLFAQWLRAGHFGLYTFICVVSLAVVERLIRRGGGGRSAPGAGIRSKAQRYGAGAAVGSRAQRYGAGAAMGSKAQRDGAAAAVRSKSRRNGAGPAGATKHAAKGGGQRKRTGVR